MQTRKADGISFIKIISRVFGMLGGSVAFQWMWCPEIYTWGLFCSSLSPYHNSPLFSKGLWYVLHLDMAPNKDVLETSPKH